MRSTAIVQRAVGTAAALLVAPELPAQEPGGELSRQVDALFAEWDRPESPGAAIAVVQHGTVRYQRGYGSANLEHRIPISPITVFDIASVSKQFAGMAIATLVAQGAIGLDDDIRTYLPDVPSFDGRVITIRHLVHHTSGLRDWPGTLAVAGWRMDDVISFEQILTMVRHQEDLNFDPGDAYSYSNTGYNLLAALVQRVTGLSFREWTDLNIFRPLGMRNTHFHDDHLEVVPGRASAYRPRGAVYEAVPNGLTALGSSSLFSTVADLARWLINYDEPAVGGRTVIARMRGSGVLTSGEQIAYAFGVNVGEYRELTTVSHAGSWAGFRTYLVHFPDQRFGVVVLSNLGTFDPARKAYEIADLYLADALAPLAPAADRTVRVPPRLLDQYVGTYHLAPGWLVTIIRDGDQLRTQATAEAQYPMTPRSETEFHVPAYGASIHFLRGGMGTVDRIEYRGIVAPRVELHASGQRELTTYEGTYRSRELGTEYEVALQNGGLVIRHRRHGTIALQPVLPDEFRGDAWFLRGVEFDRDGSGRVIGLRVTIGRSRNLHFVRVTQ